MAQNIKNKIFGSDIPKWLKQKLQLRQAFAKHSRPLFVDAIQNIQDEDDLIFKSVGEISPNFRGTADLSSRTPIARMWTALTLFEDEETGNVIDGFEKYKEWQEDHKNKLESGGEAAEEAKKTYLKRAHKTSDSEGGVKYTFREFKLQEKNNVEKIYVIGNHKLNSEKKGPNTQISTDVTNDDLINLIPNEQETDKNKFLKPPVGITSITSETEGTLGALKRTTVNFVVHNFDDFERIYLRYFLKPGATVFVDFGWDTALLYQPENLLKSLNYEDFLYGDIGAVTLAKGDLETLYGNVVNYDAKVREDGGFDCSLEIISKNAALLSNTLDNNTTDKLIKNFDKDLLAFAVSGLTNDNWFMSKAINTGQTPDEINSAKQSLEEIAEEFISGKLPGGSTSEEKRALKNGVFIHSPEGPKGKKTLYINYGWFEDNILNKEFGFSNNEQDLVNTTKDSIKNDEGGLFAKFNSKNSYMIYNVDLHNWMRHMDKNPLPFIYPETWGWDGETYNTIKEMEPVDRLNFYGGGQRLELENLKDYDINSNQIPIREIFISTDVIKSSLKNSSNPKQLIDNILNRINEITNNSFSLNLISPNYGQHTIAVTDISTSSNDVNIDELFEFNPYSPDTLVSGYDLSFTMPQNGLGNMLAIQSIKNTKGKSLNSLVDSLNDFDGLDRTKKIESNPPTERTIYPVSLPINGDESGNRLQKKYNGDDTSNWGFMENDIVYGKQEINKNLDISSEIETDFDKFIEQKKIKFSNDTKVKNTESKPIKNNETVSTEENIDYDEKSKEMANIYEYELVGDIHTYYKKHSSKSISSNTPALVEYLEPSLQIYGTSGFSPGHLVKINYLPKKYRENVNFYVTKVSHQIGETWSTSLSTAMRLQPGNDTINNVKIKKSYLKNIGDGGLYQIGNYLGVIEDIEPVFIEYSSESKPPKNITNIFKTNILDEYSIPLQVYGRILYAESEGLSLLQPNFIPEYPYGNPVLQYEEQTNEFKGYLQKKSNNLNTKITSYFENKPIQDIEIPHFQIELTKVKHGQTVFIVTAGSKWIIVGFNPSADWEEIDKFFGLSSNTYDFELVEESFEIPASEKEQYKQDIIKKNEIAETTGKIQTNYGTTIVPGAGPQN